MNSTPDPAAFARIEALFNAALERAPQDRHGFLLDAEDDPLIRTEVERLLAAHHDGDATLRGVVDAAVVRTEAAVGQIGPYRVLGELGSGGMGTVLLAERLLGDTRQQVALKLIRGYPTAQARERMARERNLLAGLNHPNIARLIDGGDTADNVPYLVMEYVQGQPLHAFCATRSLDIRERLKLFAQLCRAVQHAHQRLIVHRDIKPGNIMVREDGTAVLLDFGIGKLLDATQSDATATRVFTPAYAAPEQIAGRTVTTAADIYGLGCVLHELLSGRSLHLVGVDGKIPAPSAVATDAGQARQLRGDLDTLVGKAMHAEPERRYASAQALADDVENYLRGRPLQAAPDSIPYRLRKFVSRHRYAVAASVIVLMLAGVFVWRLIAERQRALVAERRAERETQSTRRSRDFLVSLFEQAGPTNSLGKAMTARELIDKGREQLTETLKDEPESAARIGLTIAEVYSSLGDPKAAIQSGEKALALIEGDTPERALLRADVLITLASAYDDTERFDDARHADEKALALRQRYASPDQAVLIAATFSDLGHAAARRGDYTLGRDYFDKAMQAFAQLPNIEPTEIAGALRGLAIIDLEQGKADAALRHAQQALQAIVDEPAQSPERIEPWRVLARAQIELGNPVAAGHTLEQALSVATAALGEQNSKVANIENDLAPALNAQGRYRDAIAHLEKSFAITHAQRPDDRAATAYAQLNLGSLYESLGDYAKAEALMREGIAAMQADTPDDPAIDMFRANLARTLSLRDAHDAARELMSQALASIAAREGERSQLYATKEFSLARIELRAGNIDTAAHLLGDATQVLEPMLAPEHPLRPQLQVLRGLIAKARNDLPGAQAELEGARDRQMALRNDDPVSLAIIRTHLADVLLARGDVSAARRELDQGLPLLQASMLAQELNLVRALATQARIAQLEKTTH